jgi:hypothetical protein
VTAGAIESLAENFSDGVVAPVFWGVIFGLPGMLAYKALNTADSMIGHRTEKYLHFGSVAARADDIANFIPARLSGFVIAIAAFFGLQTRMAAALRVMPDILKRRWRERLAFDCQDRACMTEKRLKNPGLVLIWHHPLARTSHARLVFLSRRAAFCSGWLRVRLDCCFSWVSRQF